MKREERSEFIRKLRAEQAAQFSKEKDRRYKEQQKELEIESADLDTDRCCLLSEIEPGRFAQTIKEEVSHALTFARLLGVEIDDSQTVLQFLETVYVAWYKVGLPLYNPFAARFTGLTRNKKIIRERKFKDGPLEPSAAAARREFKKAWVLLDPQTDYLKTLSEFVKSISSQEILAVSSVAASPAIPPQGLLQSSDQQDAESLTLFYRASITPRAGEE